MITLRDVLIETRPICVRFNWYGALGLGIIVGCIAIDVTIAAVELAWWLR